MAKSTSAKKAAPAVKKTAPRTPAAKNVSAKPAPAKKAAESKTALPVKAPEAVKSPVPKGEKYSGKAKAKKVAAPHGTKKEKTVRDSFNMPVADYALIAQLKARALASAREVKKSELLRAGLRMLSGMTDTALLAALGAVPAIKTGRPGKKHKN